MINGPLNNEFSVPGGVESSEFEVNRVWKRQTSRVARQQKLSVDAVS